MAYGRRALGASFWSLMTNGGQQIIGFLFFVFLARLLPPEDFGVIAMALLVVDVLATIGRVGQVEALVQREEIDDRLCGRLFWVLQLIGLALMGLVMLAAPPISAFFRVPELVMVLVALAPVCWLQNLSAIPEARLRRDFRYKELALRSIVGMLVGGLAGVIAAFAGWGVYALVVQRLTNQLAQNVLLWASVRWVPAIDFRPRTGDQPLFPTLAFGAKVAVATLLNTANVRLIDVMVGFFMGPVALGYLRIAWRSFDFIMQFSIIPVVNVALATFSRLRDEPARLKRAYLKMTALASLSIFPICFGVGSVAHVALPIVFGERWMPSAPLMQALSPIAVAATINYFFVPLMTAVGHANWVLRQGLFQLVLSITLTYAASQWSIYAVIAAHVARATIMALLNMWSIRRAVGISPAETLSAIAPALLSALIMAASVWASWIWLFDHGGTLLHLFALIAAGVAVYAGILLLLFRRFVMGLWDEFQQMRRARKTGSGAVAE
ncbi:lipopolysaccharide biosynthesis protein [Agaricicola taiwanensis]|uniref:Lipopolysaccharide biosynthesis protein n=1 Tax=Agaricicola taiwanensis TaxID=591372 RepID=A0A8J2YKM0_9RHOB|nr:lipopolysaccharide biosynthesis protein [Agaricicola taiwanensis]GGE48968.1 lipopolysaccharide biosynthesis protein [Agaricicola taiwanensis]